VVGVGTVGTRGDAASIVGGKGRKRVVATVASTVGARVVSLIGFESL
jgi:hypothetical protein